MPIIIIYAADPGKKNLKSENPPPGIALFVPAFCILFRKSFVKHSIMTTPGGTDIMKEHDTKV